MYATVTDITASFTEETIAQLSDDAKGAVVDETVVNKAIVEACAKIDTYLQGRYDLPFVITPVDIKRICVDLSAFYLHRRRNPEVSEGVRKMYEDCLSDLQSFQSGLTKLDTGVPGTNAPRVIRSNASDRVLVFTRDLLGRY